MSHDPGSRPNPPLVLELLITRFTTQHIAEREDWSWWPLPPAATGLNSSTYQVLSDARAIITSIRQSLQPDQLNQDEGGRLMGQLGRMISLRAPDQTLARLSRVLPNHLPALGWLSKT